MPNDALIVIQKAFISFTKRAEKTSGKILSDTFVDCAPLFDVLSTKNNQIVYGRRGTGKTHALKYLEEKIRKQGNYPIYLDLRAVGSNGAIYSDPSIPFPERSVRLILDVLSAIADELYGIACEKIGDALHPEQITHRIDDLYAALRDVTVVGDVTINRRNFEKIEDAGSASASVQVGAKGLGAAASIKDEKKLTHEYFSEKRLGGKERSHVEFGRI